jgi:hypothetical protein
MTGRLSGLKASLKADREQPPAAAAPPREEEAPRKSTRAKARENKRAVVGYFSPELQRTLNVMAVSRVTARTRVGTKQVAAHFPEDVAWQLRALAVDRKTTVQNLMAEALNDLFAKYGKPEVAPVEREERGS